MVASQDRRRVEVWARSDGSWPIGPMVFEDAAAMMLAGCAAPIDVSEVYAGILDPGGRSLLR